MANAKHAFNIAQFFCMFTDHRVPPTPKTPRDTYHALEYVLVQSAFAKPLSSHAEAMNVPTKQRSMNAMKNELWVV